jgi:ABC-type sugar transport system substrate-binding protein
MSIKKIKASAAILATSTALAAGLAPAPASAAVPGDLCNLAVSALVVSSAGNYWLSAGAGFRVLDYASGDRYYGRGNGQAEGYIQRSAINQATCH